MMRSRQYKIQNDKKYLYTNTVIKMKTSVKDAKD